MALSFAGENVPPAMNRQETGSVEKTLPGHSSTARMRLRLVSLLQRVAGVIGGRLPHRGPFECLRRAKRKILQMLEPKISYSKQWYDDAYHPALVGNRTFGDYVEEWERKGYRDRLYAALDEVDIPSDRPLKWLEVACMQGKTAFWLLQRYPNIYVHMFDFSTTAIKWLQDNMPLCERWVAWECDVQKIHMGGDSLDDFFDFVSCIDVTEHLPDTVYRRAIRELHRVCKPGGHVILMQGNTLHPAHVHVIPEDKLVADFERVGFVLEKRLPHRHYLPRKAVTSDVTT